MKQITIAQLLAFEEGFRSEPYYCSEGYPTIGIGQRIGRKGDPLECYDFTVSMEVAEAMLQNNLEAIDNYLNSKIRKMPFSRWDQSRDIILQSMAYQLGTTGLSKFKNMWKAIEQGDWNTAAKESLDSRWAKQTPERAKRHAEVLRSGEWSCYDGLIR